MKKLTIKVFFILAFSVLMPSLCFAHDQLTALIDKSDFKKFREAYEKTKLSEGEKEAFLCRVGKIIDDLAKSDQLQWLDLSGSWGFNRGQRAVKASTYLAGVFVTVFTLSSALTFYLNHKKSREIFNSYSLTAAQFGGGYFAYPTYAHYTSERDAMITENKRDGFIIVAILTMGSILISILSALGRKHNLSILPIYKRCKKSQKIKALIDGRMQEIELLKQDRLNKNFRFLS